MKTLLRTRIMASLGACGVVGLALLSFGLLCGIALDRVQAAQARDALMRPYREALQQRNRQLMALELRTSGRDAAFEREWRRQLERVGEAVTLGDTHGAVLAWRDAYGAALRRGQWRDLVEVGDAALRIGDVADFQETSHGAARRSYLTALYRAQAHHSVDGVLRAAEGFAGLGDDGAVQNCLVIAERLAGDDAQARAHVTAFTDRFVAVASRR